MKTNQLHLMVIFLAVIISTFSVNGQPKIGGYNVYYGSLHNHTNVSDGTGTPDQAYFHAKNTAKLDFFGLADHSQMMSSSEWTTIKNAANAANQDGTFAAFYGFEWTSFFSYGHVAIINTDDYCSTGSPTSNFTGLLAWLNARNGIAFFNHPGWDIFASKEFNHFTDAPSDKFVGMELWNDHDGFSKYYYNNGYYSNDGGKGYFDEALIRGWKIGAAGSDDNHTSTWGTATPWRVGVLANSLTRTSILEAFQARRFFSTLDKNLLLSFKINGSPMGSTITGGNLSFEILAADADGETFTEIKLFKNGGWVKTWILGQNPPPVINEIISCADKDYFYVKAKQVDLDEAISSPIFISGPVNQPPTVSITAPVNGTTFGFGQPVTIEAAASDPDGSIVKVAFYQGTTKLGEDAASPYSITWTPTVAGNNVLTAVATDNASASTTSAPVNILVNQPSVLQQTSTIADGKDDAEEMQKGTVILTSDDLDLVYDTKTTGNQTVGLFFRNLGILKGTTISKANIQFTSNMATTNTCSLTITGQAADDPANFAATYKNLSLRTKTTASVLWTPNPWPVVDVAGTDQQTPDIKSVVQQIVSRSGWNSGEIVIFIKGTGTRTADSYESASAVPAKLYVEYYFTKSAIIEKPEEFLSDEISIYPNPVTDRLILKVNGETKVERIMIYSITGSLMREMTNIQKQPETEIECSSFTPGIYLIRVQTNRGMKAFRFVKQ